MIALELPKYVLPERWGCWYHSFGLMAFGVHEMSLNPNIGHYETKFAVLMEVLLNTAIAGAPENKVKAQVDRDTVEVIFDLLTNNFAPMDQATCYENAKVFIR